MPEAIEAVRRGFVALSGGAATVPLRASVPLGGNGTGLTMPAAVAGWPYWSVKVVSVAPGNAARGLPVVAAAVLLGDTATGRPVSLIEGASLTALRTGAAGGVAAAALARPESAVLALFGAGVQARSQLRAAACVLRLKEVRIVARDPARAASLIADLADDPLVSGVAMRATTAREATLAADVIVTATSSPVPVFDGRQLGAGVHITAVGSFRLTMRELDDATLRGARIVVDQREAAFAEAGELQGLDPAAVAEIGEVLSGRVPGRAGMERTIFKSVGNAVQDLAVASRIYDRAVELGLGQEIAWP